MNPVLHSSKAADWRTPAHLLELVRNLGKYHSIGLDPATTADNPTGANSIYTPEHDGLSLPWTGHGLVFLNPPYGRAVRYWLAHARLQAKNGAEIVALVPARTDTRWWQNDALTADQVCFWMGRLTFEGAPGPAPFPSAILYWQSKEGDYKDQNARRDRFIETFNPWGWVVRP